MRLGTEPTLKVALQQLGFSGRLNMAFIERVNLTVRHGIAALTLRTWATAQQTPQLLAHLEWWRAYYYGCRVRMPRCKWRLCSLVSEVASFCRNAIDSVRQPWQPEEPIDDGQQTFAKKTIRPVSILLPRASAARKLHSACQMTGFFLTEREE
jgi:hypothetical protein